MNPQQKAKQLFYKMYQEINGTDNHDQNYAAYKCALVIIEEILQNFDERFIGNISVDMPLFWKQVKDELNKL